MRVAEGIKFEGDENGWEMHVTDENGFVTRFNIHSVAWDLVDHMSATIGAWRVEGHAAGLSSSAPAALTAEDLEAYPLGDPKRLTLSEGDLDLARDLEAGS